MAMAAARSQSGSECESERILWIHDFCSLFFLRSHFYGDFVHFERVQILQFSVNRRSKMAATMTTEFGSVLALFKAANTERSECGEDGDGSPEDVEPLRLGPNPPPILKEVDKAFGCVVDRVLR